MPLHGIDVSSWQSGIDLTAVPCDFVIVKATQGTSYVNPDCARAVEQALAAGKLVGVYHYVDGHSGPQAEAAFFHDQCRGWDGRVLWAVDWEAGDNAVWGNEPYLEALVAHLTSLTGAPPLIYASSSAFPWGVAARHDCGAWVAQYASMDSTGYQDDPWTDGTWPGAAAIHQYSSAGRLPGWDGHLDLNIAYMDRAAWAAYAGATTSAPAPAPASTAHLDVTAIQRAVHVDADNVVGPATRTAVSLVAQSSAWGGTRFPLGVAATQQAVGTTPDGSWGPASVHAHDTTVTAIQTALHALGYTTTVDGVWGPQTEHDVTDALDRGEQA